MGFYSALGFDEAFRTPSAGTPIHVDLVLDGYRAGLATETSTRDDHGLEPVADGQRAAVILWTDDVSAGFERLIETLKRNATTCVAGRHLTKKNGVPIRVGDRLGRQNQCMPTPDSVRSTSTPRSGSTSIYAPSVPYASTTTQ